MRTRFRPPVAFTLIELLVVIAIIRDPDRTPLARGPEGPRSRRSHVLFQQPQATGDRRSRLPGRERYAPADAPGVPTPRSVVASRPNPVGQSHLHHVRVPAPARRARQRVQEHEYRGYAGGQYMRGQDVPLPLGQFQLERAVRDQSRGRMVGPSPTTAGITTCLATPPTVAFLLWKTGDERDCVGRSVEHRVFRGDVRHMRGHGLSAIYRVACGLTPTRSGARLRPRSRGRRGREGERHGYPPARKFQVQPTLRQQLPDGSPPASTRADHGRPRRRQRPVPVWLRH